MACATGEVPNSSAVQRLRLHYSSWRLEAAEVLQWVAPPHMMGTPCSEASLRGGKQRMCNQVRGVGHCGGLDLYATWSQEGPFGLMDSVYDSS